MYELLPPRFNLSTHFSYIQTPDRRYMTVSYQDDGQSYAKTRCMIELICDWTISDWVFDFGFDQGREAQEIPWDEVIHAMSDLQHDPLKFQLFKDQAFLAVLEYVPWVYNEAKAEVGEKAIKQAIDRLTLDMVLATPATHLRHAEPIRPVPPSPTQFPVDFDLCKEPSFKG